MRWPWQRTEHRQQSGAGDFSDQVLRLIENQAAGNAANIGSTAAVETAAGAIGRAFMAAKVDADPRVQRVIDRRFLSLVGYNLVRAVPACT